MRNLVIGRGQIGSAVSKLLFSNHDVWEYDIDAEYYVPTNIDVMHICFPYNNEFCSAVVDYIKTYEPKHVVVWSTVDIGACRSVETFAGMPIAHSPVEGKHPHLLESIATMRRWVSCSDAKELSFYRKFFGDMHLQVRTVHDTSITETLKLLSTTEYGINIVFADYKRKLAEAVGMDYAFTKRWNEDYNELYAEMGYSNFQKYILDPPHGKIGGHCVVPNAKILRDILPDPLLDKIIDMEIKDGN